jgi:hypothetical protein
MIFKLLPRVYQRVWCYKLNCFDHTLSQIRFPLWSARMCIKIFWVTLYTIENINFINLFFLLKSKHVFLYISSPDTLHNPVFSPLFEWFSSRYSDWLQAGRFGDRIPVGARLFAHVQKSRGTTQPPVKLVPGLSRGVIMTIHPLLVPMSRKGGAMPLANLWACSGL